MLEVGLVAACFVAGLVNSVAGGGIMVVFPALLATGMPPITANITSNIVSWPGALSSAFGYRKHLRTLPLKYILLLVPSIIGSLVGSYLLIHTDSSEFDRAIPWLILVAVLLFALQPLLHHHLAKNLKHHRTAPLIWIGLALLSMAVYGGYFGAGIGFLMLAFFGFTNIKDLHQINGLKNICVASIAIVCTVYFGVKGLIDWTYAPLMIAGSLSGGYIGSHYAQRINKRIVHIFVIVLGLTVTGVLFAKI